MGVIALLLGLLGAAPAYAEDPPPDATLSAEVREPAAKNGAPNGSAAAAGWTDSLEGILRQALGRNGQIREAEGDIDIARAQLDRARAAMWPKGEAILIGAPIFEETGNAIQSTSNLNKWGPFLQGGVQLVQPLHTFGQISNYRKAAENQIVARSGQADIKKNEVIQQAKEFYYGYQLAHELDRLVGDLVKFLEEAVDTADEQSKKGKKGGPKPHDLYKLKTALEDLRQKKLYANAAKMTAERAIAWIAGGTKDIRIPTSRLEAATWEKKPLDEYLSMASLRRPELRALKAGQEARLALRDAKRAQSYPTIFVGAFFSAAWSPVREKQRSVFALDPFNRIQGGAGIGIRIDLEFARHGAEAAEEMAEAMKLKATESYAVPGIDLQVRKAFWEVDQAAQGLEVAERRRLLAKKWFVSSAMGWSIGVTPAKDLLEALEGEGQAKKNYYETIYVLNLSLGRLSQAVGTEVTSLKYR